ncbi:MAG: hypothetical protein KJP25_00615 [Gammaproteobacteria bacterium]|nr:hypothetical protein [Gammaproteobacteria bacterium]NND40181.1 hypothetical protein [Pseudomonadales bacterium]MBT8150305.1 hypothetical protein [Gammaproteobacteria bacterium]NNL10782.1 hypothetical protein [Pseudomonadales bacterium]NNM10828.1 hypothetical protein [Pseudomonadales bacterium]
MILLHKTTACLGSTFIYLTLFCSAFCTQSFAAESIAEAFKQGTTNIHLRLRYEDVDQDANEGANALTLKSRLTYSSADYQGIAVLLELDDVTELGDVDYRTAPNDASNPNKAIVADPEGTEVNQAYLRYQYEETSAQYGRQRILLDNQRHLGGVGFRQNEQTYDGFSIQSKALANTAIYAAYITNVNRIFGEDNAIGDHGQDGTALLNIAHSFNETDKLVAYYYGIDNDDVAKFSTDTYGIRWKSRPANAFNYVVEFAQQTDAGKNNRNYTANYYLVEGSAKLKPVTIKAGYEVLGADNNEGEFITPLATLHKFQGFTDMFLNGGAGNISGGIEDIYVSLAGTVNGVKLGAFFHQFNAEDKQASGMDDYGKEYAASLAKKYGPLGVSLKYANFNAKDFGNDTKKLWLTVTANL